MREISGVKRSVLRSRLHALIELILVAVNRAHAVSFLVALASHRAFEFCLLAGRNKVRVFFQIFDNFFGHHLALKTAQCAFD